eukprot:m.197449 g.197449  ORF g.197449 m.197449 type:complete len:1138 (-) comp17665_c0_seq1:1255-4668(-)
MTMAWTAVAVCGSQQQATAALLDVLRERQRAGRLPHETLLLGVDDPAVNGTVGSAGAIINALQTVAEQLTAQTGQTVLNTDVLHSARILILHDDSTSLTLPCGLELSPGAVAPSTTDMAGAGPRLFVDNTLDILAHLSKDSPFGVWVCSPQVLLRLHNKPVQVVDWATWQDGLRVFAVEMKAEDAAKLPVCRIAPAQRLQSCVWLGRGGVLAPPQPAPQPATASVVSGLFFMCTSTAALVLGAVATPPLDACTFAGIDNGCDAVALSFVDQFVPALSATMQRDAFLSTCASATASTQACEALYDRLHSAIAVTGLVLTDYTGSSFPTTFAEHRALVRQQVSTAEDSSASERQLSMHSSFSADSVDKSAVLSNSLLSGACILSEGTVVSHSHLTKAWRIEANTAVFGVDDAEFFGGAAATEPFVLKSGMALAQYRVRIAAEDGQAPHSHVATVVLGVEDVVCPDLKSDTCMGESWDAFFARTGITAADLWSDSTQFSLYSAKLFPVASNDVAGVDVDLLYWLQGNNIQDNADNQQQQQQKQKCLARWRAAKQRLSISGILQHIDVAAETTRRTELRSAVNAALAEFVLRAAEHDHTHGVKPVTASSSCTAGSAAVAASLSRTDECILPLLADSVSLGERAATRMLETLDTVAMVTTSAGVAARVLACIADALGLMAGGNQAGLRSGPGCNPRFAAAFRQLENGNIAEGVQLFAKERQLWTSSPDRLVRASRHYESAAQTLIHLAVKSAKAFVYLGPIVKPPKNVWMCVDACARLDLSGGWSDTPPITYEHGGAVTNAAILIDGERPIGARARRIERFCIVLVLCDGDNKQVIEITELEQLSNYNQPQTAGALLKAAFCCGNVVSLEDPRPLAQQLEEQHGCGFELWSWSNLPTGSGLGTSSILAGAVLAALWRAVGVTFSTDCLVHAVLYLEQMLTTGGGWQDQVGGLVPGLKIGRSAAALPLRVETEPLPHSPNFQAKLDDHLLLIYTGRTRLARNLLQNVVRNWYARAPEIVRNVDGLVSNAELCAQAIQREDLVCLGACLDRYWAQKKIMAPGCEPAFVTRIMELLQEHVHGQSMAGAGGGGFMFAVTKEPHMQDKLKELLQADPSIPAEVRFHKVTIDNVGMAFSTKPVEEEGA